MQSTSTAKGHHRTIPLSSSPVLTLSNTTQQAT